jgi:hypothetical protein
MTREREQIARFGRQTLLQPDENPPFASNRECSPAELKTHFAVQIRRNADSVNLPGSLDKISNVLGAFETPVVARHSRVDVPEVLRIDFASGPVFVESEHAGSGLNPTKAMCGQDTTGVGQKQAEFRFCCTGGHLVKPEESKGEESGFVFGARARYGCDLVATSR